MKVKIGKLALILGLKIWLDALITMDLFSCVCVGSEEEAGGKEQLAEEAKTGIKELMTAASVSHATVVIQTVLL